MSIVSSNRDKVWHKGHLSRNKNITIDVIRMNLPNSIGYWNWDHISECISMKEVIDNPNESWILPRLSNNPNITPSVVRTYLPNSIRMAT
jgi:hypothetical protein